MGGLFGKNNPSPLMKALPTPFAAKVVQKSALARKVGGDKDGKGGAVDKLLGDA